MLAILLSQTPLPWLKQVGLADLFRPHGTMAYFMEIRRLQVLLPQQAIPVMAIVGFSSVGQPADGTGPVAERVDLNPVRLKNSDLRRFLQKLTLCD